MNFPVPSNAGQYLEKHNVLLYMEDALCQLLEYKEENPKVIHPKFLADYFRSVHEGTHTLFRDYNFIKSTTHNKSCFIKCVWSCFKNVGSGGGELLNVKEYHSLLCLLCYDFPLDMVEKTARIVLIDDALDCLMAFPDFLYAFQIQFYYEEFVKALHESYDKVSSSPSPVVVPSTEDWNAASKSTNVQGDDKHNDGVDISHLLEAVDKSCSKFPASVPKPSISFIQQELDKSSQASFYGILMAISKNADINTEIGVLPDRADIMESSSRSTSR